MLNLDILQMEDGFYNIKIYNRSKTNLIFFIEIDYLLNHLKRLIINCHILLILK